MRLRWRGRLAVTACRQQGQRRHEEQEPPGHPAAGEQVRVPWHKPEHPSLDGRRQVFSPAVTRIPPAARYLQPRLLAGEIHRRRGAFQRALTASPPGDQLGNPRRGARRGRAVHFHPRAHARLSLPPAHAFREPSSRAAVQQRGARPRLSWCAPPRRWEAGAGDERLRANDPRGSRPAFPLRLAGLFVAEVDTDGAAGR